jgi:DNA-directed RNA polymerase sigma subunit (sigma70/sigma32)
MKQLNDLQYLTDADLIKNIKDNNCNESMKELEDRHSGICYTMIKKYYNSMSSVGVDPVELAKEKDYVIFKSALNFDASRNIKFSTWLGNQMRFHCLNCMNKNNTTISMENESIKNIMEKNQVMNSTSLLNKDNCEYIFNLLDQLKDKRIIEIFKIRYFSDKKTVSWSKIGRKLKISTQTVINLHNKTLRFLKNKLESSSFQDTI